MARTLAQFTIQSSGEDYILQMEDEEGQTVEMLATFDQLDLISEAIDSHLDDDAEDELTEDDAMEPAVDDVDDEEADDKAMR